MDKIILHYYILSDSIGETAVKFANSILAQFPTVRGELHRYSFIDNNKELGSILEEARENNGLVFVTIADVELAEQVEHFCTEADLTYYNLLQPYTEEVERRTGEEPSEISGAQHELTDQYFKRVEAMEFCMTNDDGQDPQSFRDADMVILGVSRCGKTPLCMYLALLGYKATNLPLIIENELPNVLFEIDPKKIIGLTNNPEVLSKHRISRMREYGMSEKSRYASSERIQEELSYADKVYRDLNCPVINVADRSIEESASIILDLMGLPVTWP